MESNLKCWLWLSSMVKISPRKRLALLNYFRDPVYLWEAGENELRASQLCTPKIISYIMDNDIRRDADKLTERIRASDISVVTVHDASYPQMLKYTADPPAVLYCRGRLQSGEHCVAVVGSRKATWYGLDMSKRLSSELARHGVTVVSGMARGVDSKAHYGALEAGGRTIAVLGCGVDIVYPAENRELMEEICKKGAVISEFLPGTEPIPFNFPARNRIISGLSRGVVIVEASEKSGSLITADYALEQGRDVFAVPGNINSMNSSGTNRLIREGARIITCAGDILDEINIKHEGSLNFYGEKIYRDMRSVLNPLFNDDAGKQVKMDLNLCDAVGKPAADAGGKHLCADCANGRPSAGGNDGPNAGANVGSPNDEPNGGPNVGSNKKVCSDKPGESAAMQIGFDEKTIAEKLINGPAHIDAIARDCGISVQLAGSVLLMLELSGFVEQLPGKFYRLVD